MARRVLVIGLDCAAPELLFDRWLDELPALRALTRRGRHGVLRSCDPPITVPAWACMTSSRDPGALGVYGFRNRPGHDDYGLAMADSRAIHAPRLWDILSRPGAPDGRRRGAADLAGAGDRRRDGRRPLPDPGHPGAPLHASGGISRRSWRPSSASTSSTSPSAPTTRTAARRYRGHDRPAVPCRAPTCSRRARGICSSSSRSARTACTTGSGASSIPSTGCTSRATGSRARCSTTTARVDRRLGELVERAGEDAAVLVVSDHGAMRMDGGVCVNEWLRREGYLVLHDEPASPRPLRPEDVDWRRTDRVGEGGYYCRLFVNVAGREREGAVAPAALDRVSDELRDGLQALGDHEGRSMPVPTVAHAGEELYGERAGVCPDLLVYFGGLHWRSIGLVGTARCTGSNDTGPDDANHAPDGLYVDRRRRGRAGARGAAQPARRGADDPRAAGRAGARRDAGDDLL